MAEAIISGVLSSGVAAADDVSVGEPLEERRRALRDRHGVSATAVNAEAAAITEASISHAGEDEERASGGSEFSQPPIRVRDVDSRIRIQAAPPRLAAMEMPQAMS